MESRGDFGYLPIARVTVSCLPAGEAGRCARFARCGSDRRPVWVIEIRLAEVLVVEFGRLNTGSGREIDRNPTRALELVRMNIGDSSVREALAVYLLAIADDELILGHRHSEWTGFAPDIESDVALSSIAQEEMGHAKLFYEQVCGLAGGDPDTLAFGRSPEAFRNAVLVERPNDDWGFSIVRLFLYDRADAVRLAQLAGGSVRPLADLARALHREEKYHLMFGQQWLERLAEATDVSRERMQAALDRAWPEAVAVFEPVQGHNLLVDAGVIQGNLPAQGGQWRSEVVPVLERMGLRVQANENGVGGRAGQHTGNLQQLVEEMTSVWRSEPGAKW